MKRTGIRSKSKPRGKANPGSGCDYSECFVPPERHDQCAAEGITPCWGRLEHQHVIRRSAGGKRCDVMLCSGHHQCIDSGHRYEGMRLANRLTTLQGEPMYEIYDRDSGQTEKWVRIGEQS